VGGYVMMMGDPIETGVLVYILSEKSGRSGMNLHWGYLVAM